MRLLITAGFAALAASCTAVHETPQLSAAAGEGRCAAISAGGLDGAILAARWVPSANGLPAFCEVTASLTAATDSSIGAVYRLPQNWNGKLLGLGGGGWAGNVTLAAASEGLRNNYATLQTDGGNAGTDVWANSWAAQRPASAADFSHRAVHLMTVAGKALAAEYYGQQHQRAYFQGCSTGGRMALMEAQRYPDDYDAIIAGAPVYTLQVQSSAVFRNQTFAAGGGAGSFSPADLQLVQSAVMAQCDAADGLADGIINDPAACNWQPVSLLCSSAKTSQCLSAVQVSALQRAYDGMRASDGSWAMHPMRRGGEAGWAMFVGTDGSGADPTGGGGLANLFPLFFGADHTVTLSNFSDANYLTVRASPFAAQYEAADPDLSPFFARGGKLILWHGENDAGPSPVGSLEYAQAVIAANPAAAAEQFSYFTLPGVGHCRGGPGADQVDFLDALDLWMQSGSSPAQVVGSKADGSLTRPHCAWPNVARYRGTGDADNPASWQCVPRR